MSRFGPAVGRSNFCNEEGVPVKLMQDYQLLPLSENVCMGVVSIGVPSGTLKVVQGGNLKTNGLMGDATLVQVGEDKIVPVRIVNVSNQNITLPQNKIAGCLVDAELAGCNEAETVGERFQHRKFLCLSPHRYQRAWATYTTDFEVPGRFYP